MVALFLACIATAPHLVRSTSPPTLINHPVVLDSQGGLLSWLQPQSTAYSQFVERSLVWFYNGTVPRDPQSGLPFYYVHGQYPKVAQETVPARQVAWGVEGAVAVYAFTGNRRALDEMAIPFAAYVASPNGTAQAPWAWAGGAFACGNPEALVFRGYNQSRLNGNGSGDGYLILEPDKAADAGLAYATLYQVTGAQAWLAAALATADALVDNMVAAPLDAEHSPWPFRVHAVTGAVLEYYGANVWPAVRLFDALADIARVGGGGLVPRAPAYASARARALAWVLAYPVRTMAWQGQWEDMAIQNRVGANVNSYGPSKAATYLLDHREGAAPDWLSLTGGLLDFLWRVFVVEYASPRDPPLQWGAPVVAEQTFDQMKMGIHTAHWAAVAARYASETGNATLGALAARALNWATYTLQVDNTSLVCNGDMNDWFPIHAVMPAYFVAALAAAPAWSGTNESHILRWTSPLRGIGFAGGSSSSSITYTTYDPAATVWLSMPTVPTAVTANGTVLPRVPPGGGGGGAPQGWWSATTTPGAWGGGGVVVSVTVHTESAGGDGVVISTGSQPPAPVGVPPPPPPPPDVSLYDVSWSAPSPPRDGGPYLDGMPLGNGATVVLAWANTTAGGVSFYVRHPHAQHTDSTGFTLARVTVGLSPNPFLVGAANYFNQTHHLEDGSVTILAGGSGSSSPAAVLRIFVDAHSDTVVVTAAAGDGATPFSLTARVESVRPTSENYTQEFYCFQSSYRPDVAAPLDQGAPPGSISLRHDNCVACGDPDLWAFSTQQQGLRPALPSPLPASPLDGRVFGVGVFGGGGEDGAGAPLARNPGGTTLTSAAPQAAFALHVCVRVGNEAVGAWEAGLAAQLAAAARLAPAARSQASAAWWASFWSRSWISLPGLPPGGGGGGGGEVVPQYTRTRFIQAAQSRGVQVPIKFNGQLFTSQGGSKGPLDVDARDWGPDQWWQNTRLPYGAMLAAGDYDTLAVVLDWAASLLPLARARTALLLPGVEGTFFTEIVNAFGLYQGKMYGGPDCNSRPPGYPPWLSVGGWVRWDFSGNALGPEAGLMALDLYLHTGNLTQARKYVPIATNTLDFIATFYKNRSGDGRVLIWPTQVLESWWCDWPGWSNCPQNDMPTVAAATALVARLLALPPDSGLLTPSQRASYAALAALLPALPTANGTWLNAAVLSTNGPGHREVAELFPAHPFRLVTAGRAAVDPTVDLATGRATFNGSANAHKNIGWYYGGIDAALLGLADEAWAMVVDRSTNSPPDAGYRYPAFAPHLQDSAPSADHYANLMTALQAMLLQAGGDEGDSLVLLPAWPCALDVTFKLWGARNTSVSVVFANSTLVAMDVQPPERAAAVKWARCVGN